MSGVLRSFLSCGFPAAEATGGTHEAGARGRATCICGLCHHILSKQSIPVTLLFCHAACPTNVAHTGTPAPSKVGRWLSISCVLRRCWIRIHNCLFQVGRVSPTELILVRTSKTPNSVYIRQSASIGRDTGHRSCERLVLPMSRSLKCGAPPQSWQVSYRWAVLRPVALPPLANFFPPSLFDCVVDVPSRENPNLLELNRWHPIQTTQFDLTRDQVRSIFCQRHVGRYHTTMPTGWMH